MTNILLITYFFPPTNATGCRRVYSWAKYLKRLGHKLIVITADVPDEERVKNFNIDCSSLPVHRLKYFDIRGLIKKIFRIKGPISDEFSISQKKRLVVLLMEKILKIILYLSTSRGILFGWTRLPTFSDLWFLTAYKKAKTIIKEQEIKVIITSSPPPIASLVGMALKRRFKQILWIQDLRDLWTQDPTYKGLFPFTLMENFLERKSITNADVIILVSEILKQRLEKKYPHKKKDMFLIENGYDEEFLREVRLDDFPSQKLKKTIVYTGTLYLKRRNPQNLFQVIDKNYLYLRDKLEILFYGPYETMVILNKFFDNYPATKEIIVYKGFLSPQDIICEQKKADVLLFIETDKEDDGVLTAKIFEYMMFRKPILCLGIRPFTYVGSILKETGLCIFCDDDLGKIEESLEAIIKDQVKISPHEDFISQFSREKQVKRLDQLLRRYLK